jgi:hypothetical protein
MHAILYGTQNNPLHQAKYNKITNNENSEIFRGGKPLLPLKVHVNKMSEMHESN